MTALNSSRITFEDIQQAFTRPLPGMTGQKNMAPTSVTGKAGRWETPENCREAGVLLLIYPENKNSDQNLYITLIRRPQYQGVHSGQIALPGGRREPGESLQFTALRETREEVGVRPESLCLIGKLSMLYSPPSNFCIYPFVAFSAEPPQFQLNSREVAELIEAPLHLFFDPTFQQEEVWHLEKYGKRRVPFFYISGHKVWGATAMIMSEFVSLLTH